MNKKHIPLKHLPAFTRPREKLLSAGVQNLSEAELLAIILGSGSKQHNVLKLSEKIMHRYSLSGLSSISVEALQRLHGVGPTKATKVVATIEFAKRINHPNLTPQITSTKQAATVFSQLLQHKKTEHIAVVCLNTRNHIVAQQIVAVGSTNSAQVQARDIFAPALQSPCTSILMAHNHPSGDCSPSEDDYQCTKKIQQVGSLLGIPLLDHLVIAKSGYFSFREAQLLEEA